MGGALVNATPVEGEFLSAEEVAAAFEALSPENKLKLAAIEFIKRRGTGFEKNALVGEAVYRALAGVRRCPRGVVFMAFLVETMRSIANHDREKRWREDLVPDVDAVSDDQDPAIDPPPTPEETLMSKQEADAIHRLFEGDQEAQLLLMGWEDALRGAELRDATGLDQGQVDYAAKRIRKKMNATYPQGRIR